MVSKLIQPTTEREMKLDYLSEVANWFLGLGDVCVREGNVKDGLLYNHVAARILIKQNRDLVSVRLESNLRFFADRLPGSKKQENTSNDNSRKDVCLHVLNEAMGFGGVIAMATRWIKHDQSRIHHVAILSESGLQPKELVQTVTQSGGKIHTIDANKPMLSKAEWLRRLANDVASFVVLHTDVDDVISGVAFGSKGGPPVMLVNHAAHIFWVGASIADLVVNCRGSQFEEFWTKTYRGIPRCTTIPIPLSEHHPATPQQYKETAGDNKVKLGLGVPEDAILILTVGAAYKYTPFQGIDFLSVCESILSEIPKGFLVAAGVIEDARWREISERCGFRIKAVGSVSQAQLSAIHSAADLYIEGFPFGSTTALLEAGLRGIPVVLGPEECPPPYCTDGIALDDLLSRPKDIAEYKSQILRLCKSLEERSSTGQKVKEAIKRYHTGIGWLQLLQEGVARLPMEHGVYPDIMPVRTPEELHQYWAEFLSTWSAGYQNILEDSILHAFSIGLRPNVTQDLKDICQRFSMVRVGETIPLPWLALICNKLLPLFPISKAHTIFRVVSFLCKGGLLQRLRKHVFNKGRVRPPHEQYRANINDQKIWRPKGNKINKRSGKP